MIYLTVVFSICILINTWWLWVLSVETEVSVLLLHRNCISDHFTFNGSFLSVIILYSTVDVVAEGERNRIINSVSDGEMRNCI